MPTETTATFRQNGVIGAIRGEFAGKATPNGSRPLWVKAPSGSMYWNCPTPNQSEQWLKVKNDARNDDWVLVQGIISQRITKAQMTDGGAALGTKDLNATIPVGATVQSCIVTDLDDFAPTATVTFTIGDASDVDRYMTGTPSAAADADYPSVGVPSGTAFHATAATPRLYVTDAADFTALTAGAMTITIRYTGVLLG
jgi:hypothetical protein